MTEFEKALKTGRRLTRDGAKAATARPATWRTTPPEKTMAGT